MENLQNIDGAQLFDIMTEYIGIGSNPTTDTIRDKLGGYYFDQLLAVNKEVEGFNSLLLEDQQFYENCASKL